jgi:hypothetical protein
MINNGNHYHPADGVFVAPISGVYMFAWSTLTYSSKSLFTELRVEKEVKGAVGSNAAGGYYTPGSIHYYFMSEKENTCGYRQAMEQPLIIYLIGMILRHSWDFCFRKINCVVC